MPGFRYLDEQTFIDNARLQAFQSHQGFAKILPTEYSYHYRDLEEFSSVNPDCCSTSSTGLKGFENTFFEKINGKSRTFVHVHYRRKTTGAGQMADVYYAVTNCGRLWDGIY
jgi:hypothetical protein